MTENEAINVLEKPSKHIRMVHKTKNEMEFYTFSSDLVEAFEKAIKALEELQQYRAVGLTPQMVKDLIAREKKAHKTALENANMLDEYRAIGTVEELQEIGSVNEIKMVLKKREAIIMQLTDCIKEYQQIGTVDEFKALKENQRKCEDCAGCTTWKCDCANERDYAITQFANFLHEKAKENNGLRLSSETRSWTHPCIFDYLKEFKENQIFEEET